MEAFTKCANTLQKYLQCIKEFQKEKNPSAMNDLTRELDAQEKLQTFFRGHKNEDYKWMPSIFRDNGIENEAKVIKNCLLEYPAEFYGLTSDFDRLAKIQHYGGATRILDFSVDPLVALFMACDYTGDDKYTNGTVAVYRTTYSDERELGVRCLAFLATYQEKIDSIFFDRLREHLEENHSDEVLKNAMKQHYFVIPRITNERLRRQKGAFLIFGHDGSEQKTISCLSEKFGRGDSYPGYIRYITIPAQYKKKIRIELRKKGITQEFLMPNIQKGFVEIVKNAKRKNTI